MSEQQPYPGWSAQQPPPAPGWGAPSPTPAPGWGGPSPTPAPGWGAPSGGWTPPPPPAPKPGVVPLRPLGLTEILDGAFTYIRRSPALVLGISAVIAVVSNLVQFLITATVIRGAIPTESELENTDSFGDLSGALGGILGGSLVATLVALVFQIIGTGMLTVVVARAVLGEKITWREAWTRTLPLILPLLAVTIIVSVTSGLGLLLCLVPGVFLYVSWALATPALMLERRGIGNALSRSWYLVTGSRWRVLGILLLAFIISFAVAQAIAAPFAALGFFVDGLEGDPSDPLPLFTLLMSALGGIAATTVTLPFTAGVTALLYVDQRIRREAFDIDLMRSAGLEPPAAPGPMPPGAGGPAVSAPPAPPGPLAPPGPPTRAADSPGSSCPPGPTNARRVTVPVIALPTVALPRADAPVVLSPDEAREAARRELGDPRYAADDPSLPQRVFERIFEEIGELLDRAVAVAPGGLVGLLVLSVAAVALAAVFVLVGRRVLSERRASTTRVGLFDDAQVLNAADHRREAERARRAGDWTVAIRESVRAMVRTGEEQGHLEPRVGRTADEAATELAAVYPQRASAIDEACRTFDDVVFGGREGDVVLATTIDALDRELERSRAQPAQVMA